MSMMCRGYPVYSPHLGLEMEEPTQARRTGQRNIVYIMYKDYIGGPANPS